MKLDEQELERDYQRCYDAFSGDSVQHQRIAPLVGFVSDVEHVQLADNVAIERLTEDERLRFVRLGQATYEPGSASHVPTHAIRGRYDVPKLIGELTERDEHAAQHLRTRLDDFITYLDGVPLVLHAYKGGYCECPVVEARYDDWLLDIQEIVDGGHIVPIGHHRYELLADDVDRVSLLWSQLRSTSGRHRKYIDVTLRRLMYANEKPRPGDRLVDLLIAAEALFLSETGDMKYRSELRYRLSLSAALFIGKTADERRKIYREMREAYDVRSSFVHGGSVETARFADGSRVDLQTFSDVIKWVLAHGTPRFACIGFSTKSAQPAC